MSEEEIVLAHVGRTPPGCIRAFRLSPAELPEPFDDSFKTVWRLGCPCGADHGKLLGHPLRRLKAGYSGHLVVSPLGFVCGSCNTVTELLDTDLHGFHAAMARIEGGTGSAKIRGTGQREAFPCPSCGAHDFAITTGFVYWDFEIALEEPELAPEEFFHVFLMYCRCTSCGRVSQPTDFGKL